ENNNCREDGSHQDGWSTWDIVNEENLGNYPFPADGAIFLEDNVWVNGQIDTARLTIGSSRDIIVDNDLIYSNYDGQDAIGLIARRNVNIGLDSEDDLRIDGALVAQDGRVGRYYYSNKCIAGYSRATITLYGMIATYDRYNFSYDDGTGYQERFISYDPNLSFNPPPFFPSVSDQYVTVSWDEIK
ncbi:MAG: hypothetical protein Q8Q03_00280, partial [bacterium]|nr:hypothetical protein [bacterium]